MRLAPWFRRPGLALALLCTLAVLLAHGFAARPLEQIRNAVFDQYQSWQPRAYTAVPVTIIDIDEESLRRLGQWPWPRARLAQLTQRLHKAKAAAIVFDVLFAEPDRTAPSALADSWDLSPELAQQMRLLPDPDTQFAQAISQGGVVLGLALNDGDLARPASGTGARGSATASSPVKARFVALNEPAQAFVRGFESATAPLPLLAASAAGAGAINFLPDSDGVIRRVPLLLRQGDVLWPGLALEALRVASGQAQIVTQTEAAVGLVGLRVGPLQIPTTARGEAWLHYALPRPERYVPAWQVLAGVVPANALTHHIVLVGLSAKGLMDTRSSALGTVMPGIEIHAQWLEQVLSGDALDRPAWAPTAEWMFALGLGLLMCTLALYLAVLPALAVWAALSVGLGAGSWWFFSQAQLLLDPSLAAMSVALAFVSASVLRHVQSERQQSWLKQAFSRYVSPNLVNHVVAHPEQLALGGQRRQCSFVFTDLEGFATLLEDMDPAQAVGLLNGYLEGMMSIAFAHEGTLDRIVGDGIAILFSAPLAQADHTHRALQCALAMQRYAAGYALQLHQKAVPWGETRIGVHTGEVIVGNFGGKTMFDYRALGDPVNTASRLEGANRHLGTWICASAAVMAFSPSLCARPIGRLVLKGKSHPLLAYELLGELQSTAPDRAYQQAFEWMRDGDARALAAFETLVRQRPQDRLCAMHWSRLVKGTENGNENSNGNAISDLIVLDQK